MQVLIPIAGPSPFFKPEEYFFPKPLVEVRGRPMIELVVSALRRSLPQGRFVFLVPREDAARFSLDATIKLVAGADAQVLTVERPTPGALCTCLLAVDALDPDGPLLISNGDQVIDADLAPILDGFQACGAAAGVVTFPSGHPRWSYVQVDAEGNVVHAAEKQVISAHAVAGLYFFRRARDFLGAAMRCIEVDDHSGGGFYIAPALNQILIGGGRVVHRQIAAAQYHSFYSPQKIQEYTELGRAREAPEAPVEEQGVAALTEGTLCTVLQARAHFQDGRPLLVANADQLVDFDCGAFVADCHARGLDGSILVFRDPARDPKWSFARLDERGLVAEVAEKRAISNLATVGIYYFRSGAAFAAAAVDMLARNDRVNGEFYACPVYNYLIRAGKRIGVYEIAAQAMHGLGTPADLDAYLAATGAPRSMDAPP
ncbi:MAG: NTP transferase domain-containing protein [Candidatus Protistobacter heckmanni]|nr:NTP transferase domain-containing protein [Candidatus Protistobacter heckmanni]